MAIKHMPIELRTPEICLAAVKQNGWALAHVPVKICTFEVCTAAIEQDSTVMQQVPTAIKKQLNNAVFEEEDDDISVPSP